MRLAAIRLGSAGSETARDRQASRSWQASTVDVANHTFLLPWWSIWDGESTSGRIDRRATP